jgi:RNA polymerase sigma factor (sigma-70 family)
MLTISDAVAISDTVAGELPGDTDAAIRQLYARHAQDLRRYVERFCPDLASADDIVQETFIRAWRHLPQLSSRDYPVRPWLFRVARNLLIDADRAARSRPITVPAQAAEEGRDDTGLNRATRAQTSPAVWCKSARPRSRSAEPEAVPADQFAA